MDFDYRIVATPYAHSAERLAIAPPERPLFARTSHRDVRVHVKPAMILSPQQRLRASVGPQQYGRLLAAKRSQLSRP